MEPADSIGRLGFTRWYERRLIEGHLWFVSGFACMVLAFGCLEDLTFNAPILHRLGDLIVVVAAGMVCVYGIFRYQQILVEAESLGERATCARCGVYARFRFIPPVIAHCRKCEHEWRLIP